MNLIQKSVLLSASALLLALPDVCAISESEAINKTLWLNTGGHYGNLPGEDQGRLPSEPLRYQYDDSIWDDFDESEYAIGGMNKWLFSIENGILVSNALDDLNDHGEKCGNLSGLYSEFSLRKNSFSSIRPEYLLRFAWAAGSSDSYDDVVFAEISLGFNLRWRACDFFALSAGCRAGVGALIVSKNLEEEGKRGCVYGGGARAEWILNENNTLVFACEYLACTAEPEIEQTTIERQSWLTFSFGWKFTF